MRNQQQSQLLFSYAALVFLIILCIINLVKGDADEIISRNAQNLFTSLPAEMAAPGYPNEKLLQLRMKNGNPQKVNMIRMTLINIV